jgi:RNA polymerase sigma-70 factor (ECF subfamily)
LIFVFVFEAQGESGKFEYLYGRYKGLLFSQAWGILRDYMLAEDAVSEAYIRIYRNLHKIEGVDSPRSIAFMVTIARNCALTILRKNSRETVEEALEDTADSYDLEVEVLEGMSAQEVYGALDALDEQAKTIFLLKYAYDLPHSEIAAQTGLTENNVTVKLHRTKKKLKKLLLERR